MELIDAINQAVQKNMKSSQPTDLCIGTVTSAAPLEITINTAMAPLRESVLYLTEGVIEKKIPVLAHTHQITALSHTHTAEGGETSAALSDSYETAAALQDIACLENGAPLPVQGGYILLNRALQAGDKVLLLRVQRGQKFVVLSRVFGGGS